MKKHDGAGLGLRACSVLAFLAPLPIGCSSTPTPEPEPVKAVVAKVGTATRDVTLEYASGCPAEGSGSGQDCDPNTCPPSVQNLLSATTEEGCCGASTWRRLRKELIDCNNDGIADCMGWSYNAYIDYDTCGC
jgi:hypothetical protein